MTGENRIERALPRILEDLGAGPLPDYTDSILGRTAVTRQRPGWVFIERWLPMDTIAERTAAAPRLPLRVIAVVALILVALAVSAMLISNAPQRALPAPYGPAGNGLVVYELGGNVYIGDPATGDQRAITTGPELDRAPFFSLNGSKLLFLRSRPTDAEWTGQEMIANADGSDLHQLTSQSLTGISGGDWSGDGRSLVIISDVAGRPTMTSIDVESGDQQVLDVNMAIKAVSFRPPNGSELLFLGEDMGGQSLYVMNADGSNLRSLLRSPNGFQEPAWSPDGMRIAYGQYDQANGRVFTHIVRADGTGDVLFQNPAGVIYQLSPLWSPDGKFLLVGRGYWDGPGIVPPGTEPNEFRVAIVAVDASVADRELEPGGYNFGTSKGWSPDGTKIVTQQASGFSVMDIATHEETNFLGWFSASWQRVAPAP